MRKFLGFTGLLALLVIPMTGSANAGVTTPPPKKAPICVDVKVAANVSAGANIGLYGTVLKKSGLAANASISAELAGDVYVRVCVLLDADVALTVGANGLVTVVAGTDGCVDVDASAGLAAGLTGGSVSVTVDVLVGSDKKQLVGIGASLYLAPLVRIDTAVLADVNLCVSVGDGEKKY